MATEENHPSLYSALHDALSDRKLIGDLLLHPDFRRRAGQICRGVVGPKGGEELLQEACLRVLESADDLDLGSIRSEGEFFAWFTRLAQNVHLSNVLSAAAVNNCTQIPQRWPDSTDDVPPDDIGQFLAHADACPYHARILRAEDEELRAAFDRARGLDSRGRILLGEELDASIAEHRRRLRNWREAASKKGDSFGHVALFNGGVEVASGDKFYDFSLIHKSRNELDPDAGLQIYGVSSGDPDETVLLGFYALAGVRHGGKEKVLDLDNGYTVCLKVEELGGNNFEIHFRCVRTETLEEKADEAGGTKVILEEPPGDGRLEGAPCIPGLPVVVPPGAPVLLAPGGWWPPPRSLRAVALVAVLLIVALPSLLVGKVWGRMEELDASFAESLRTHINPAEVLAVPSPAPITENRAPARSNAAQPEPPQRIQTSAVTKTETRPLAAAGQRRGGAAPQAPEAGAARVLARGATIQPGAPAARGDERAMLDDKEHNDSVVIVLRGPGHMLFDTQPLNRVVDRRATTQLLSYNDDQKYSAGGSVLHVTKNDRLGVMLGGALRKQSLRVVPVTEPRPEAATVKVNWDVSIDSPSDTKPFVVTLWGYIFGGGEKIFGRELSYIGVGSSLEAAYNDAVRQAAMQVVRWSRPGVDGGLRASVIEVGGAEQHRPKLPEVGLTAAYGGPYGYGLIPGSQGRALRTQERRTRRAGESEQR